MQQFTPLIVLICKYDTHAHSDAHIKQNVIAEWGQFNVSSLTARETLTLLNQHSVISEINYFQRDLLFSLKHSKGLEYAWRVMKVKRVCNYVHTFSIVTHWNCYACYSMGTCYTGSGTSWTLLRRLQVKTHGNTCFIRTLINVIMDTGLGSHVTRHLNRHSIYPWK